MIVSLEKEFHENRMNKTKIESTWPNELMLTDLQTWAPQLTVIYMRNTVSWGAQVCSYVRFITS